MKLFISIIAMIIISPLTSLAQEILPDTIEAGWKGKKVCEVLYEDEKMRAVRCVYPPGVGQDRHYHPPYFSYVISGGSIRITTAEGTREATSMAGRSSHSDGVAWHELVNIGDTTIDYIAIEEKN